MKTRRRQPAWGQDEWEILGLQTIGEIWSLGQLGIEIGRRIRGQADLVSDKWRELAHMDRKPIMFIPDFSRVLYGHWHAGCLPIVYQ